MPELLALAACEKVIFDDSGNASLIVLIENIAAEFPEGAIVPSNTVTPRIWSVFTIWKLKPNETVGKNYRHVTEVVPPDKNLPRITIPADFSFKGPLHKVSHNIVGFPIGVQGILKTAVWLETPDGKHATDVYEYPIQVTHKFVKMDSPVTAPQK